MSRCMFPMISSLRSRSLYQYHVTTQFMTRAAFFPKNVLRSPETNEQALHRKYIGNNIENQPHTEPTKEQVVMDILSDFAEKHRGTYEFKSELQALLTSDRLKDLGVGYKNAPIPNKSEWKASWREEGKPNWLGTCRTDADGCLHYTASITGYLDKEGRKGGFGVIFFDIYGRPKVASVGVCPEGHVPPIYYDLQGVRSALQLALAYGFGSEYTLYCNSGEVEHVLDLCLESMKYVPKCMAAAFLRRDDAFLRQDGPPFCNTCVGYDLYHQLKDFDVLFPVINEIVLLLSKLKNFENVTLSNCIASTHLAKLCSMPTTEEMHQFKLVDDKQQLYEMEMKPEQFPEEMDDLLYDEAFKGDRIHTRYIMLTEATAGMDPVTLYHKLTRP